MAIGGNGKPGLVSVLDGDGRTRVSLEPIGKGARLRLRDDENRLVAGLGAALNAAVFSVGGSGFDGNVVVRNAAGTDDIRLNGRDGEITVHDDGRPTVLLNGETGEVTLAGADAEEEFEIAAESASSQMAPWWSSTPTAGCVRVPRTTTDEWLVSSPAQGSTGRK